MNTGFISNEDGAMPPVFGGIAFQAECSISLSIIIPSFCKTRGRAGIGNKKIRPSTEGRILVPRYHPDSWRIWLSQALYNVQTYAFPVTWKWRRRLIGFSTAPQGWFSYVLSCRIAPYSGSLRRSWKYYSFPSKGFLRVKMSWLYRTGYAAVKRLQNTENGTLSWARMRNLDNWWLVTGDWWLATSP